MNPYPDTDHLIELENLCVERDHYRGLLQWLGNPKNPFGYSITVDGQIRLKTGPMGLYPNLIAAIEAAQKHRATYPGQYR